MECFVYANLLLANEGETVETEWDFPQLKFNWKKCFKSAWLNFASLGVLLTILAQIQIASAHYATNYVSTNGSCLNVRTGPSLDYDVIKCVCNGESLPGVVSYENGFAQLESGNWVSAEWISDTHGYGYNGYYGVGGEYPGYFSHHHHYYHNHHHRHHYYHNHHHRDDYSSDSSYPRHHHRDYASTEYYSGHHHRDYASTECHSRHHHQGYESSEYYLKHYHHHYY